MARDARIDVEGSIHHVYTRGTKRWLIFHDDADRRRFLGTLSGLCDRYEVTVLAYCLMDNHVHLVLQSHQAELSAFMRDLKSIYARWFNLRHSSSGPIFEDRFGSKIITSLRQLRNVVRYVHRNPLDIDRGMTLGDYRWSSHPAYLGDAPCPVWLDLTVTRPLFDDYRRAVETPIETDKVQNDSNQGGRASGRVPGTRPLMTGSAGVADVVAAVAQAGQVSASEVCATKRNGLVGMVVVLALEELGLTPTEVAEPLGYRTIDAVQKAGRRCKTRMAAAPTVQATFDAARNLLLMRDAA